MDVKGARITKTVNGRTRKTFSISGTGVPYVTESSSKKSSSNRRKNKKHYTTQATQYNNKGDKKYALDRFTYLLFIRLFWNT